MPPRPTGTVEPHGDHFDARVRLPDGTRSPRICLPAGLTKEQAKQKALDLTELAHRENARGPEKPKPSVKGEAAQPHSGAKVEPAKETVAQWSERWLLERRARGLTSVDDDEGRLRKWILPKLGEKPMATVERAELEAFVEEIDASVRVEALSWKTAGNVWGVVSKMFADACESKNRALRVRQDNPAKGVRGPDKGAEKSKSYLYPAEFAELVACTRVPVRWRRLFALAAYTYARPDELEALEWEDVDLAHRIIHIHRAIVRVSAGKSKKKSTDTKPTKTKVPRHIPIEAALVPLLEALRAEAGGRGRVVPSMPPEHDIAPRFRQYLRWAGVDRAELHANDRTRKQIRFRDLRATGLTWMALRGDEPLRIMQRAGHEDFSTTMKYVREAENLRHAIRPGDVFPALPAGLIVQPNVQPEGPATWAKLRETTWKKEASPAGFEPA